MSDPGPEISGGVDRVTGRASQRQPDAKHHQPHLDRPDRPQPDRIDRLASVDRKDAGRYMHQHRQHQHRRRQHLTQEIRGQTSDRRAGAEGRQLGVGIVGDVVVGLVKHEHQRCPHQGAGHLGHDVTGDRRPGHLAGGGQPDGYGRVEMRAADVGHAGHRDKYGKAPAGTDHDPPRRVTLGLVQDHVGHHAVAQQDQQRGSDHLGKENVHGLDPPGPKGRSYPQFLSKGIAASGGHSRPT